MAASDVFESRLKLSARRAYERGRLEGALVRGAAAALLATPGFLFCISYTPWAAICLAGFGLVVAAGRVRGGTVEEGSRAGAVAGILPCLLPAALRAIDPELCMMLVSNGLEICGIGGAAAGIILGLRGRLSAGLAFWAPALTAFGFAASLGCLPSGAVGFAGLGLGLLIGAAPALAWRRAHA